MINDLSAPKLITFDGEARSGKGTIVQATKDYLRDVCRKKVMLIDRGQTFRALVVAAARGSIDIDDPDQIDAFLSDDANIVSCTNFVKEVYQMPKEQRDGLLYTNEVGENSAKIGARPASQKFVQMLTKKWMSDAKDEGFNVVLLDGRALEPIARDMDNDGLCDFLLGLYFICEPVVGALRTLGYAKTPYQTMDDEQKKEVDGFVAQINDRNQRDFDRSVEPLVRPLAEIFELPDPVTISRSNHPAMAIIDTSAHMTKEAMAAPIVDAVAKLFDTRD